MPGYLSQTERCALSLPLREIVRSREDRKDKLRGNPKSRQRAVDTLHDLDRRLVPKEQMSHHRSNAASATKFYARNK